MIAGLLVDIDGVLTISWEPLPGVPEAVAELRAAGVPMRLATNTTTRTRKEIVRLLAEGGIAVDHEDVLTAPVASAAYLRREYPGARCLLLNEGDLSEDLEGVTLVESGPVDVVLLGGAGPAFTYQALNAAFRHLTEGAALVAIHRNLLWRTSDGLQLDSGGFVGALEEATGVEATVVGKPSSAFFVSGLDALGQPADRVAMIGDDVVNDVLAAQEEGITGVLVRTGKAEGSSIERLPGPPDIVLDSFADVPRWLSLSRR